MTLPDGRAAPRKSTATVWKQAPGPAQKYRDRQRITLPTGEKRDVAGYGPTRRAATADLTAKVQRLLAQATTAETITVTQLMARLLRHKRSVRGCKRSTLYNDLDLYKRHVRPAIGTMPLDAVTLEQLQAIQAKLVQARKYRTAELATVMLKSLFKYAVREYRAEIRSGAVHLFNIAEDLDPVKRPATAKHRPADTWEVEQLAAFLAAAKATYDRSLSHLLYPVFHTAIAAGLRRGELLGLKRADFLTITTGEATRHVLTVRQQLAYYGGRHHADSPKSDAGQRRIPIGPELAQVLRAHVEKVDEVSRRNPRWARNDLMFPSYHGRPIEPRNLYRARDKLINDLGLPHVTLHELRKLYATYVTRELIRRGAYNPKLVMQLMGHSKPDIALSTYTLVVESDVPAAAFDPIPAASLDNSLDKTSEKKDAVLEGTAS